MTVLAARPTKVVVVEDRDIHGTAHAEIDPDEVTFRSTGAEPFRINGVDYHDIVVTVVRQPGGGWVRTGEVVGRRVEPNRHARGKDPFLMSKAAVERLCTWATRTSPLLVDGHETWADWNVFS